MTQPPLGSVAQELYDGIAPLAYADEANDWVLAYLCEAFGSTFQIVADYARDTDDGKPGWSILLDLDRCPPEALGWLAQFNGVTLKPGLSDEDQRARIKTSDGFSRGTLASITAAAKLTLTGEKKVLVHERYDETDPEADKAYHLTIRTLTFETPDDAATEAAIRSQKPAGIVLHYEAVPGQDFDSLLAGSPTFDDVSSDYTDFNSVLIGL